MNSLDWLRIAAAVPQLVDSIQQVSPNESGAQKFATVLGTVTQLIPVEHQEQAAGQIVALGVWTNAVVSLFKAFQFPHQVTAQPVKAEQSGS